jgi:hypothetical protein
MSLSSWIRVILVAVLANIELLPMRAAGPSKLPVRLAIYYGYPSLVNGARGDIARAASVFEAYDIVVLGDGLEFSDVQSHRTPPGPGVTEHEATKSIITLLHRMVPAIKIYGYICLGSTQKLQEAEVEHRVRLWRDMGVHGIFLDEAGYDFGVTRERQNAAVKYIHDSGLRAFMNSYSPDDIFSLHLVPLNSAGGGNPHAIAAALNKRDLFLLESFQINNGAYEELNRSAQRTARALEYRTRYGPGIVAVTTTLSTSAFSAQQFTYAWWSAALWGLDGFGWGEPAFSSSDNLLSRPPCNKLVGSAATRFASPPHVAGTKLWRDTDRGRVWVEEQPHRVVLRRAKQGDREMFCGDIR